MGLFGKNSPSPTNIFQQPAAAPAALPDPLPSAPQFASGAGSKPSGSRGFSSTIMTSPSGDPSATRTARRTLLGAEPVLGG